MIDAFFPQLKSNWCLTCFRVGTVESGRSQLAEHIDYCSIPTTNFLIVIISALFGGGAFSSSASELCRLAPPLLASIKQTYRNPPACIAAKWPYGGALHLEPWHFLSLFGFSAASLDLGATAGGWRRRPRALSSALCLALPFIAVLSVTSRSEPGSVCTCVCGRFHCCRAAVMRRLTWSAEKPAVGIDHGFLVPQTLTLMLQDAATG